MLQADSPEVVLKLVQQVAAGNGIDAERLGVDPRQVSYYRHAAIEFDLIIDDKRLTNAGRALLALPLEAQWSRLALAFEQSACARQWVTWSRERSIFEIDASRAAAFLEACADGVSGSTIDRRTRSLKAWLVHTKKWHPALRHHPALPITKPWRGAPGHTAIFESGQSAKVVQELARTTQVVRVATAYLSVNGYEILAAPLEEASFQLLVGSEDAFHAVADILRLFKESLVQGTPSAAKRGAIRLLHKGVVTGAARVRRFTSRYRKRLHAKVYLFDGYAGYITSANLSRGGLRSNIECGYVVRDEEVVSYYLERFDEYFAEAEDLVPELLPIIEASWAFALEPAVPPYLLYLRALLELFPDPPELSRENSMPLANYQEMMVAAVLHVLQQRRRALLVAPTGTGKTVVGSYVATVLLEKKLITRVIVLCPNARHERNWLETLARYGRSANVVTHGKVQGKGAGSDEGVPPWRRDLGDLRDTDLVIVDECHVFRNQETQGHDMLTRILDGEGEEIRPWLLLLTATPMSRGIKDLNTLIALVGEPALQNVEGIAAARGVVNVTLPFIVDHFGVDGSEGRGLVFKDGLRHFARVAVRTTRYPSFMESVLERIARMRLDFRRQPQSQLLLPGVGDDSSELSSNVGELIRCNLMRRAESSPRALLETVKRHRSMEREYVPTDPAAFEAELDDIRRMVSSCGKDAKLMALVDLLRRRTARRVLIFSMYTDTVMYLHEELSRRLKPRKVGIVHGGLSDKQRGEVLTGFAPEAQSRGFSSGRATIDILVATDVISEGENLQDANVVVNYDLPWTPLYLIQRIGRVDRPTSNQREVLVWNFYPESPVFDEAVRLWERLSGRADQYAQLSSTYVFGDVDRDLARPDEADARLVRAFYEQQDFEELRRTYAQRLPTSAWLVDRAKASKADKERALALPEGILTARRGRQPGTFVMLAVDGELRCVFEPAGGGELQVSPDRVIHEEVLEHIRADPEEPAVPVTDTMTDTVGAVVDRWIEENGRTEEDVSVVCGESVVE